MNNPFQEQLLKAGLVSKQQVNKANQDKLKKNKVQRHSKAVAVDPARLKAQQAAAEKARRDLELNQHKQQQARKKAISIEIDQLITHNLVKRDKGCEIAYNFEHRNKVNRIYVDAQMKQQIVEGRLGIARIAGRYELVPYIIAEKIQQRNDKRVVVFEPEKKIVTENDPYADYQIPDDLMW